MQILFVSTPAIGHVFPMVPLAWALRTAGHDVLVATAGRAMAVEQAGLPAVNVAPDYRPPARAGQGEPMPRTAADVRRGLAVDGRQGLAAGERLVSISAQLVDRAVDLAEVWRPDLVVSSQIDGAGLVVAGRMRVPLVNHRWGFLRTDALPGRYHQLLGDALARHGVRQPPLPAATIDVAPASMADEPSDHWPMRYIPYNGGGQLAPWLDLSPSGRPRVAVTLGTVAPTRTGIDPARRIIDAVDGMDVELVLALGDDVDTGALGTLPAWVRVAAAEVRAEMHAMPLPATLVEPLTALADTHRPAMA